MFDEDSLFMPLHPAPSFSTNAFWRMLPQSWQAFLQFANLNGPLLSMMQHVAEQLMLCKPLCLSPQDSRLLQIGHAEHCIKYQRKLGLLQVEKLDDPVLPVARIVQRCPAEQLMGVYKTPAFEGAEGLLQEISMARGKLLPGGLPNVEAAARIVLQVPT